MSLWSNILQWGIKAAQSDAAKQAELKAVHAATEQLSNVLAQKVPDLQQTFSPLIDQVAQTAVAGILSKIGK